MAFVVLSLTEFLLGLARACPDYGDSNEFRAKKDISLRENATMNIKKRL